MRTPDMFTCHRHIMAKRTICRCSSGTSRHGTTLSMLQLQFILQEVSNLPGIAQVLKCLQLSPPTGAGESSTYSAANEGGPCYVLEDSNTTTTNPWSYNEYSNVLYIDQPVGVSRLMGNHLPLSCTWLTTFLFGFRLGLATRAL
jgi:hypothetical protein